MSREVSRPPKKILIIKPSSLGDIVHSLPFLNAIKTRFSRTEIHWIAARGLQGLLECHPMIEKVIVINKDEWKAPVSAMKTLAEFRRLVRELRSNRYDLAIDLQGLLRSGVIAMATGAPLRAGFAEAREGSRYFYNRRISAGHDMHAVDRYLKIAAELGCDVDEVNFPFPLRKESPKTEELKRGLDDYVVIVPGARWDTKMWSSENFGRLASALKLKSVLIGGNADIALAGEIAARSDGKALSVAGDTTIPELIDIMRGAKLVISNDSGPMHIAAALNIPVAALFGPTSPERTGPYGRGHLILKRGAACSPCFKRRCRSMRCMRELTFEFVRSALRDRFPGII